MIKNGKQNIVCTYCQRDAVSGTYPPVCAEHNKLDKKASSKSSDATTIKELERAVQK